MPKQFFKTDPFFHSIFLSQFYKQFITCGNYYKIFIYFFFLNKLFKKKKFNVFKLLRLITLNYYFSVETKSKFLPRKRKKKARKFKRKRKKQKRKGVFKKLFFLKVLNSPQVKLFKLIKKFYILFLIKKDSFFLSKLYNSYLIFFFFNLEKNFIKKQYLREKYHAVNHWSSKHPKLIKKILKRSRFLKKKKLVKLKLLQIFSIKKVKVCRQLFIKDIKSKKNLIKKIKYHFTYTYWYIY